MKTVNCVLLAIAVCFLIACGGGGGDGVPIQVHLPEITHIDLLQEIPKDDGHLLYIGEKVNINVYASDQDLNMTTMYISEYLLPNLEVPFYFSEHILPVQEGPSVVYFFLEDRVIEGPVGDWFVCFIIVDALGNESADYCINVRVREG